MVPIEDADITFQMARVDFLLIILFIKLIDCTKYKKYLRNKYNETLFLIDLLACCLQKRLSKMKAFLIFYYLFLLLSLQREMRFE